MVLQAFHIHAVVAVESVVISAQGIASRRHDVGYNEEDGVTHKPAGDAQPFDARLDSISQSLAKTHIDVAKQQLSDGVLFGIAYPVSLSLLSTTSLKNVPN